MKYRLLLLLLIVALPAYGRDMILTAGFSDWEPSLTKVQKALTQQGATLSASSDNHRYFSLSKQTKDGWRTLYYTRWKGTAAHSSFALKIHNFGSTYGIDGPFGFNTGGGANLFYLDRTGTPDHLTATDKNSDWLWGGHVSTGFSWDFADPLALDLRRTWHWVQAAELDGVSYDLDGAMWSVGVSLMF
jgi:hypothetical protein